MTEMNDPAEKQVEQNLLWCPCEGWAKSMPSLTSAQMIAFLHKNPYTGEPFSYCPWCGARLGANFVGEF